MDRPVSAFVSTRALADMEDGFMCDGGATSTLTKSLENCTLVQQKVVDIQTAHGGTQMSTTHRCLKTYYVRDSLGEIRPIVVKADIVIVQSQPRAGSARSPLMGAEAGQVGGVADVWEGEGGGDAAQTPHTHTGTGLAVLALWRVAPL